MRTIHINSWVILLSLFMLAGCGNRPFTPEATPTEEACHFLPPAGPDFDRDDAPVVSFIKLVDQAWLAGEISEGERLVYMAYSIVEPSSIPEQFIGRRLVEGTSTAIELVSAIEDPTIMCRLKPCEQAELKRLLDRGVDCGNVE